MTASPAGRPPTRVILGSRSAPGPPDDLIRAHPGSPRLAGLPDFFAWPLPGPFEGHVRVSRRGVRVGPELEEILHLQAAAAQQPDHVAVAEVELHRLIA